MNIQPIVFAVPSAPATAISKPSVIPWIAVAIMGLALAFLLFRGTQGDGPLPPNPPPVVNTDTVAEQSSKAYAKGLADSMRMLAEKVRSKEIANDTQLQSNAQALTKSVRERAFATIDALDNANVRGDYAGREAAVASYLEQKATGHERASK